MLALHRSAVVVQLAVGERAEGVGARGAHDDVGLVLLLNDGLGGCHQLALQTERDGWSTRALPLQDCPSSRARVGRGAHTSLRGPEAQAERQPSAVED